MSPATSGQAKWSVVIRPVSLKSFGFTPRGATGPKSITSADFWPARCTTANPMPPRPEFHGSAVASASAVPTAASIALPPASRMATPASAADFACAATMPRRPFAEGFVRCQCMVSCGFGVYCIVVLLSMGAVLTRRRRVATGDGAASPSFAQRRFGIPTGMEDALDEHRVDRDNEGDSDPSFEPG